tara:strand:+ start:135 stop:386 length:252 start_codon:yes stop_codon:yes gene_type:complete
MSKFISKKAVFQLVAKSLKVSLNKINEKSSSKNHEEWDSLSQLNILIALDKELSGKARNIKELSDADSIKKIIQILNKKKLIK